MSPSNTEIRWVKFVNTRDFIVLVNDVIAVASGNDILFLNLTTREEIIEKFDSPERGKGVSCLAAHPVVPMFATVEKRSCPKIFIFTHPGIRRVSNCVLKRNPSGFLSCVFAGSDYLSTLTGFPKFRIHIWAWRTGEILASIDTTITDRRQRMVCCRSSPYQVSQLGEVSGDLVTYEINVCSKTMMISPTTGNRTSTTSKIVCTSWSTDGNLFQCDLNGNVTLNFNDGKRQHLVVQGNDGDALNFKGSPLIDVYRSGIIVVDRESCVRFYRKPTISDGRVKSASPWKSVWSIRAKSHPLVAARSTNREGLLFYCEGGEIFELTINDENESPEIHTIIDPGAKYVLIAAVEPRGDQIVTIDEFDRLSVLHSHTGKLASELPLKIYGSVRCIASHPVLPLISIATATGNFLLVNLVKISRPSIATVIHLQRESLEIMRYSWSNDLLGIGDAARDKLFVIDSGRNNRYTVTNLLHFSVTIVDFLIYEDKEISTNVLVLAKTNRSRDVGQKIVIYSVDNSSREMVLSRVIEMTNMLDCLSHGRSRDEILVVPYLTKQLHFIKIQEDFRGLVLSDALTSGHQLRNIKLSIDDNFIVTFGHDGLIVVRSKTNVQRVGAIFMSHHRLDGGTKMAIVSSSNTIVSLGRNGNIAATKFWFVEHLSDPKPSESAENPHLLTLNALQPSNDSEDGLTWVERNNEMNLQREREECAGERHSILEDFSKLRDRLKELLDANEREAASVKFAISDFDLDKDSRARRINESMEEEKRLVEKLERETFQRDQVSEYLRKLCWDSMEIRARTLSSIDGKIEIDNFPIPKIPSDEKNRRQWENFVVDFHALRETGNDSEPDIFERFRIIGTTTHRFLPETWDRSINQIRKCPSYMEDVMENTVIRDRERKLKIHFNKLFEDARSIRDGELTIAAQRLREIRHCSLELRKMFGTSPVIDETLSESFWRYVEISGSPSMCLETDDSLRIGGKRDEEEEKRFESNDSFREKTLEKMMDGLLEVRWEDEIKKDPPRPSCLSTKDPSTYTEEETAECELYRIKCEEVERDRKKYKKMLEDKILELETALRTDFESFDRKLNDFRLDRMKLESAILQETLMRLRQSQRHLLRREETEAIEIAREKLESAMEESKSMSDTSMVLENVVMDVRNRYENLTKREKTMDGKFRGEFPDLKQPIVEHLSRHYRKRPRNVQLTCTSVTYLTEIGRCVVNCENSEILPKDCSDFLRGIDSLDAMPNNLPAQIDSNHWTLLCKLRRAKVELEIKTKICAVDLAESEQTLASHQKSCAFVESKVSQLKETMKELELRYRESLDDMQVQLVLKMGQIEYRLHGEPGELSNAVLVPFSMVESANNAIIEAGREKLAAMNRTVVFRRKILWQEWRHECMQMRLGNMGEELKVLQGIKVTREIQNYLLIDSFGLADETKATSYERVLVSTEKRFSEILKEKRKEFDDKIRKISSWREKNRRVLDSLEKMKLASFQASVASHDENRQRDAKHRIIKLRMIMERTRLKKKVQENYSELLALQTQLELLRLKTYPTLRLKGPSRMKKNNREH